MNRRTLLALLPLLVGSTACPQETQPVAAPPPNVKLQLPNRPDSIKFVVFGDSGTGEREQYQVGTLAAQYRTVFPFTFGIMLGDNLYGGESARDFERKFERPYKALLDAGVKFYASLGNHDNPNQRFYKLFNMNGERYYTFKPKDGARFFALDTTYMAPEQLAWVEKELAGSGSEWKIAFMHHPLYSSGERHGSSIEVRKVLEPIFMKHGVNVVFAGHDHFYERIKPQNGIYHFVQGASGKLRRGNIDTRSGLTAKGYDQDHSFMIVEIDGDKLYFQAIARSGQTIDHGVIERPVPRQVSQAAQ